MQLEGRVALVTGASRGIGRAVALRLATGGAAVAVNYRSQASEAQAVVDEILADGGRAIAVQADVADFVQMAHLVGQTLAELGGLHILVNNAGIARDALIHSMQPDDWLEVMRVNFGGVVNGTKAAMPHFMQQRQGAIVNVSSVMGERAWIGTAIYAASKAAINAFTRNSAVELARFGVRVNAVLPGLAATDLTAGLMSADGGASIAAQVPLRTFALVEDVAGVVAFLAGPGAGYMTGALVPVDGGSTSTLGLGAPLPRRSR